MFSEQRWRIHIRNLETRIRVGIHAHEREPQRVVVNAVVEAMYSLKPKSIAECFSYEHVHQLVVREWPQRGHVALLEHCVAELLEYIFRADANVVYVKAGVCKPDIFAEAESVGVEAEWTRADFERLALLK